MARGNRPLLTFRDRGGNPMTLDQALAIDIADPIRQVEIDRVDPNVTISTVWLMMLDHHGMLFETLIFGGPLAGKMWRYATEAEAIVGHLVAVDAAIRARMGGQVESRIEEPNQSPYGN